MNRRTFLATFLAAGLSLLDFSLASATTRNVKNYGAKGDGKKDDTAAIKAAMAALQPGDTLVFPVGTYKITDYLRPPSNCILDFQGGSKIVQKGTQHIFWTIGLTNVTTRNMRLRHDGTQIIGNAWRCDGGSSLTFLNTTVERTDSVGFNLFGGVNNVLFDGFTYLNGDVDQQNIDDAIDFGECHDVELKNFDIRTNDDSISFKAWGGLGTYNVHVHHGKLKSRASGAIAFGTEINTTIHDILIENVEIVETLQGVFFKLYEGYAGEIHDVEIRYINHHDSQLHWPQTVIYARKLDSLERTSNISIHDYSYVGEPYDGVHLMRVTGFNIYNFTATVPANDSRYAVWLEEAHNNSFSMNTSGFPSGIRQDGSCPNNTFAGVYS